jgi:hypothetical protein
VVSPAICRPTTAHCFCDGISSEATNLIMKSTIPHVDQQQGHALAQNPAGPRIDPILCCSFLTLPGVLCQNLVFPDRQKIMGWRFHYCDTGAERYVSFVTLRANRFHLRYCLTHFLVSVPFPGDVAACIPYRLFLL